MRPQQKSDAYLEGKRHKTPCVQVVAKAYDNPIPGYKTNTVGNLRLWEATPVEEFRSVLSIIRNKMQIRWRSLDALTALPSPARIIFTPPCSLEAFNEGNYVEAVEQRRKADDISAVLYPNDATEYGKELRLKQQVFFVSASIQVRPPPSSNWAVHA